MRYCLYTFAFFILVTVKVTAQGLLFPQEYFFEQLRKTSSRIMVETPDSLKNVVVCGFYRTNHSSIFPNAITPPDEFVKRFFTNAERKKFAKKLFQDHLINKEGIDTIAGEEFDYSITVDPIFNFTLGQSNDTSYSTCYTNSRGVYGKVNLNGNLQFETAFIENQSVFPVYLSDNIAATKDALGQGRWKKFKTNGYDYAMSSGVLWWQPVKWLGFYAGHGKQKIGNGYRSLFLSDQAFNYPYARFDLDLERIHVKYLSAYALLANLTPTSNVNPIPYTPAGTEPLLQRKPFSFQYLSWNPHWRFRMGMFQSMVWQPSDSKNKMNVAGSFLNPVIFANTAVYGFDSYPKLLIGFDADIMITKNISLYGQYAFDGKKEKSGKKGNGIQSGLKFYNAFNVKNFFLQGEFNMCNNQLYQNNTPNSIAGYSHYNRLLSLPVAFDNNKELVGIFSYRYKRFVFYGKGNYLKANNIIGNYADVMSMEGRLSFIINPSYNANIGVGAIIRDAKYTSVTGTVAPQMNQLLYFSFKTSLYNVYLDL